MRLTRSPAVLPVIAKSHGDLNSSFKYNFATFVVISSQLDKDSRDG